MKYPVYERYKDSGVEWLGVVPKHWEKRRLKLLLTEPLKYGANVSADLDDRDLPRYIRITDVNENGSLNDSTFRSIPEQIAAPYMLSEGDILLARSGATVGKSFQYRKEWGLAAFAGYLIRCRFNVELMDYRYASLFFNSNAYWEWINSIYIQATIQNISAEKYGNLFLPLPPIAEQKFIITFIEQKIGKIDSLIEKKQALIEKLNEKRTALITRAVIKGLDENVPMKDSGVEWLGEVPVHWGVLRTRFVVTNIEQGWSPQCHNYPADDDQWGVMKVGCVNGNSFDASDNKALPEEINPKKEYELFPGDILISRANTRDLLGSAALIEENVRRRLLLCDKLYRLKISKKVKGLYLLCFLRSSIARYQYEREATGASGSMQNIGQDTIQNLQLPLPPIEEQHLISETLRKRLEANDRLKKKIDNIISGLKEYRTALITAAVTGKIDVRKFKPNRKDNSAREAA